jgi:hypothetical protein
MTTGKVKWRFPETLDADLRADPGVHAGVVDAAAVVLGNAYARAWPHIDTGGYVSLLKIEDRGSDGAAVVAGAEHSNYVEWGTSSRRSPDAPTPTESPQKLGILPQLILTGAIADSTR